MSTTRTTTPTRTTPTRTTPTSATTRQHRPVPTAVTGSDTAGAVAYETVGNRLIAMLRPLPRRLLGVWAHPDDEAYLSAGLMARVVEAGGQVTVLTATRGEKGTDDPARYDSDELGDQRARELAVSLGRLGVTDLRMLGVRDGECDLADAEEMIGRISAVIRATAPDAIVTFGPDGVTHHPDHRAVSAWTTEAWRRIDRPDRIELLYAAATHDHHARHRRLHDRLGVYADCPDGRPATVGRASIALECALTDDELDRKRSALAAHESQTTGPAALIGESAYREWVRTERFRHPNAAERTRCSIAPDARVRRLATVSA